MLIDRGPIKEQIIKRRCSCCEKRWARWHIPFTAAWTGQPRKPTIFLCQTCKKAADQKVEAAVENMYNDLMNGESPRVRVYC